MAIRKGRQQGDFEIYRMQADIAKALANAVRIRILTLIGHREIANGALLEDLGISKANLSQHVALLRRVGLISERRDGLRVFYRLTMPEIKELCASMRGILAKRLAASARTGNRLIRRAS
jgi:DNA-binding transcriptional ArsR family regulator